MDQSTVGKYDCRSDVESRVVCHFPTKQDCDTIVLFFQSDQQHDKETLYMEGYN